MARVNTYLNFQGQTEEAFTFYAKTFGTEITMLSRFSDGEGTGRLHGDSLSGTGPRLQRNRLLFYP